LLYLNSCVRFKHYFNVKDVYIVAVTITIASHLKIQLLTKLKHDTANIKIMNLGVMNTKMT